MELSFISTFMMLGVIILIHLVHYPSFKFVDVDLFQEFHEFHSRRISLIVIPLMLFELCTSVYFFIKYQNSFWSVQLFCVFGAWISTYLFSVKYHHRLSSGRNIDSINKLCKTNLYRTIFWFVKSILILREVV